MQTDGGRSRSEGDNTVVHPRTADLDCAEDLGSKLLGDFLRKFSPQARAMVRALLARYARNLITGAVLVHNQRGTDSVSEVDVVQAETGFQQAPVEGGFTKLGGIIGGIVLGGSLQNLFPLLDQKSPDKLNLVLTVVAAAAGAFLIARDLPPFFRSRPKDDLPRSQYQKRWGFRVRKRPGSPS